MSQKKHFIHDSECCTYVCSTPEDMKPKYDFYYCDKGDYFSYLARYGNKPEEYLSGIFHGSLNADLLVGLVLLGYQAGKS